MVVCKQKEEKLKCDMRLLRQVHGFESINNTPNFYSRLNCQMGWFDPDGSELVPSHLNGN